MAGADEMGLSRPLSWVEAQHRICNKITSATLGEPHSVTLCVLGAAYAMVAIQMGLTRSSATEVFSKILDDIEYGKELMPPVCVPSHE